MKISGCSFKLSINRYNDYLKKENHILSNKKVNLLLLIKPLIKND